MDLVTAEVISEAVLSITCISPVVILQLLLPPQLRRNRYEIRLFLMVFRWVIGFMLIILCVLLSDGARLQQAITNNAAAMTIRASIPRSPSTPIKVHKSPQIHSRPPSATDKERSPPSPTAAHVFSSVPGRALSPPSTHRPVPKLIMRDNSVSDLHQSRVIAPGIQMSSGLNSAPNSCPVSPPSTHRSYSQIYYTFPASSTATSSTVATEQAIKPVDMLLPAVPASAPMSPVQEERGLPSGLTRHRIHVNPPPYTVGQMGRTISGGNILTTAPSTSALPLRKGHSSRAQMSMSSDSPTRGVADEPEQSPIQLQRLLVMPDMQSQYSSNDRNPAVGANEVVRLEYTSPRTPSGSAGPSTVPSFGGGSNNTSPTLLARALSPSMKQTRSFTNSPVHPELVGNGVAGPSIGELALSISTPNFCAEESEEAIRMVDGMRLPSTTSSSIVMIHSPKARERLNQSTETHFKIHSRTHSAEWNNQELRKTFMSHSADVTRQPSPSQIDRLINAAR